MNGVFLADPSLLICEDDFGMSIIEAFYLGKLFLQDLRSFITAMARRGTAGFWKNLGGASGTWYWAAKDNGGQYDAACWKTKENDFHHDTIGWFAGPGAGGRTGWSWSAVVVSGCPMVRFVCFIGGDGRCFLGFFFVFLLFLF